MWARVWMTHPLSSTVSLQLPRSTTQFMPTSTLFRISTRNSCNSRVPQLCLLLQPARERKNWGGGGGLAM